MVTFHAGKVALVAVLATLAAACSREQQDWRSAEGADTSEAWARFIEQHPDSELAAQARARIAQRAEQRDWQHATRVASADAYREFLAQHPNGRWSEEARIRIEAFSLGSAPRIGPQTTAEAASSQPPAGVRALHLATAAPAAPSPAAANTAAANTAAANTAAATQPLAASAGAPAASGYGVQLGAFSSEANADREWQRLQGRFGAQLGGLAPRVVTGGTEAGQLYWL
jgi:cell division septation protein DedD